MKIATIVQGEYRTMDKVTKHWNFKEQCDFYVHTWDKSKFRGTDIIFDVTVDMIKNNLPNVKAIKIANFNKSFDVEESVIEPNCDNSVLSCDIIMFNLINSIKLLLDSGNEYDFVVIARPDTPIIFDRSLQEFNIKNDRIYGNGSWIKEDYDINADYQKRKDCTEQCTDLFYVIEFNLLKKVFAIIQNNPLDIHNHNLKRKKHFGLLMVENGLWIEPLKYLTNFGILRYDGHFLNFPNGFKFRELTGDEWHHFLGVNEDGSPISQRAEIIKNMSNK
jgi:hypothetical protein